MEKPLPPPPPVFTKTVERRCLDSFRDPVLRTVDRRIVNRPQHTVILAGDPHGNHEPILRACAAMEPGTLILLGDLALSEPLKMAYAPVFKAGWDVKYVGGNHDYNSTTVHDFLFVDHPDGDLHLDVIEVGDLRIAGLGGVFRKWAWFPRASPDIAPWFERRADLLAQLPVAEHWRGGLPLKLRDAIFPEDFEHLAALRVDILITHEVPATTRWGFTALDFLADAVGACLLIHGHLHASYCSHIALPSGRTLHVRGLGKSVAWMLELPTPPPWLKKSDRQRSEL